MMLYEVTVSRVLVTVLYVYADCPADAEADALDIQGDYGNDEFQVVDTIIDVEEERALPEGEIAWSGGPVGNWVTE